MAGRVKIKIAGHEYVMRADETEEYMNTVAKLAQSVVAECGGTSDYASTRALILATVNLADRTMKAERKLEEVLRILEEATLEATEASDDVKSEAQQNAQQEETITNSNAQQNMQETETTASTDVKQSTQEEDADAGNEVSEQLTPDEKQEMSEPETEIASPSADEKILEELRAVQEKVVLLEKEKKSLQSELTRSRSRKNKRR